MPVTSAKRAPRLHLWVKIALLLILISILSVLAAGTSAIVTQYRALIEDTGGRLTTLAHLAASHLSASDLDLLDQSAAIDSQAYQRVHSELRQMIEAANQMPAEQIAREIQVKGKAAGRELTAVYAYTLSIRMDQLVYGADAFTMQDQANFEAPGTIVDDPAQMANVQKLYSGWPQLASEPYTDRFGTWITGYAPVLDSQGHVAGVVCIDASITFIHNQLFQLGLRLMLYTSMLMILSAILASYLARKITQPITQLSQQAALIGTGDFTAQIELSTGDEIEALAASFNQMAGQLQTYVADLQRTTMEKERIESELKIAHTIQVSMLPRIFPPFPERPDVSVYATMIPAKEVGGDFYDFFLIDEDQFCFLIGDVSGKGVPAALFMVIAKSLLKNQALLGGTPSEILSQVNKMLCADNEQSMFVTLFLAILDTRSGQLTYANAGHNPPLLARRGENATYLQPRKGFVLGGFDGVHYSDEVLQMQAGDTLCLYTDGVTEAMDNEFDLYGESRLIDRVRESAGKNEREIVQIIQEDVTSFAGSAPQSDDITLLVVRYNPS